MTRKKQDTMPEQELLDAPAKVAEYSAVDAGLAELRTKVEKTVYDVTTTAGDKVARALRAECVTMRTSVEKKRVEAKAPLLERERLLDAEANRIKAEILKIEKPLDAAIKAEEKRKADEKAAKDRAEAEARQKIDQAISDISFIPVYATGKTAAEIENLGVELAARELTADEFGDRISEAGIARGAALQKLRALHAAAVAAEQQAADLDRVRREQEAEAERIRLAKADLEQQQRDLAAKQRAQHRQDAIGDTLDAGTKATMAPLPEPEAVAGAAPDMIDMTGPEIAGMALGFAIRDAARDLVDADAADVASNGNPTADDIIEVIADFYDVPPFTAEAWLRAAFGG